MGAVDLVVQVESPPSVASGLQRVGRPATRSARSPAGCCSPSTAATSCTRRWPSSGCGPARSRRCSVPPTRSTSSPSRSSRRRPSTTWDVDELFDLVRRAAPFASLPRSAYDATLDMLVGPLPVRRVRRAAAAAGLGPRHRHAHRPAGRPAARGHQRRHDPRPRAVRRLPGRREGLAGSASSTRRWSTSPGSATSSRSARRSWRIEDITHDRVLVSPAPGPARPAAVLEGRPARPPGRAGRRDRRLHPRARRARRRGRASSALPRAGLDEWAADNLVAFLDEQREATPATLPTDRTLWSSGSATSSATGGSSCTPRSARRCTPRGRWRSAPGCASATASTRRRMPSDDGIVLRIPETDQPTRPAPTSCSSSPTRSRSSSPPRSAARRCSPPASASAPPARCCSPGATPAAARRCGSSGSARAQLLEVAGRSTRSFPIVLETVRECLQDVFDVPALVELMRDLARAPGPGRRGRDASSRRRSRGRCCSATSPRSSTRATSRWPSGGPPRCRSTRRCSPSCSAGPSCASCSTPRCSPSSRPSCSGSPPTGRRATPRASPTCSGCSGR